MSLSDTLNNPDFKPQDLDLQRFQEETSRKKKKAAPLSQSTPTRQATKVASSSSLSQSERMPEKTQVAPEKAIQSMLTWVNRAENVKELTATGTANLRALVATQSVKAQTEAGLFSGLFSSASKRSAQINATADKIDKDRLIALVLNLKNDALSHPEELIELLARGTLDAFSKDERELLVEPMLASGFIAKLSSSPDAYTSVVKAAYSNGQLYRLFQYADKNAIKPAWIKEVVVDGMRTSIHESTKQAIFLRILLPATPTLKIPLDTTGRQACLTADPELVKTLDTLLAEACLQTTLQERMNHQAIDQTFVSFMRHMITTTAEPVCRIPIPKSCFEKPKLAQKYAAKNIELMQRLTRLSERAPNNAAKRTLHDLLESTPKPPAQAEQASMVKEQALSYDLLAMMQGVVIPSHQEKALLANEWKKAISDCQAIQKRKLVSIKDTPILRSTMRLLENEPSLKLYEKVALNLNRIRLAIDPSSIDNFCVQADFYLSKIQGTLKTSIPKALQADALNIRMGRVPIHVLESKLGPEHKAFLTLYKEFLFLRQAMEKGQRKGPDANMFFAALPQRLHEINPFYDSQKPLDMLLLDRIKKDFQANIQAKMDVERQQSKHFEAIRSQTTQNMEVLTFFFNGSTNSRQKIEKLQELIAKERVRLNEKGADFGRECIIAFVTSIPEKHRDQFIDTFFSMPEPKKEDDELITGWGHLREAIAYLSSP